jgi:hypothetical protein
MQRDNTVDEAESMRRRNRVRSHHLASGIEPDADQLADYELYIQGKMEMDEYQQYLLFKHAGASQA